MLDKRCDGLCSFLERDSSEQRAEVGKNVALFWDVALHALFWLDLPLSGSLEGFKSPAPFSLSEQCCRHSRHRLP